MTFRAFDTFEDAKTFQKFLISIGYEKTGISKSVDGSLYRVYFEEK